MQSLCQGRLPSVLWETAEGTITNVEVTPHGLPVISHTSSLGTTALSQVRDSVFRSTLPSSLGAD